MYLHVFRCILFVFREVHVSWKRHVLRAYFVVFRQIHVLQCILMYFNTRSEIHVSDVYLNVFQMYSANAHDTIQIHPKYLRDTCISR